ncbi:nucleic acid-binding, OB-fold protein [Tanacetum coccineum]
MVRSYSWKQYIADVAGYITNVGRPIKQRTCSGTLEFYLANQSVMEMTKEVMPVEFSETRVAFIFQVRIDNIRIRKGWNFPTCGGDKCKKGVCKKLKGWWCNACDQEVAYPVLRFNLELGVSDETTHVVVVMFDETASELVKCSADSIAQAKEESLDDDSNLLHALTNILGGTHTLELKSHTYYEHGTFESFTRWKLHLAEAVEDSAGSSIIDATTNARRSSRKRLCMHPFVLTPLKPSEEQKRIREELEDSDAELLATPAEEKKKKRCVGYKVGRPGPGDYTSPGKAVRVMQNK